MARLHTGRHKVLAAYRSYHGATAGAIALTGDPRRWPSEPAACPGVVHFWGPYPYRSAFHADTEEEECERALAAPARRASRSRARTPSPRSSSRRWSAPTASWCRRPATSPGVREICDEFGILLIARRGDGRLRPLRRVVRRRPLGRHARPDHLRQGRQLAATSRSAASSSPTRSPTTFRPAAVPRRAHLLRAPAGLRLAPSRPSTSSRTRASSSNARALGDGRHRPGPARARRAPPVRSARSAAWGSSGRVELVRDRATREPLVPFNAGGARRQADERVRRRLQGARPVAVHPLQPHPRRAAVHDDRG